MISKNEFTEAKGVGSSARSGGSGVRSAIRSAVRNPANRGNNYRSPMYNRPIVPIYRTYGHSYGNNYGYGNGNGYNNGCGYDYNGYYTCNGSLSLSRGTFGLK